MGLSEDLIRIDEVAPHVAALTLCDRKRKNAMGEAMAEAFVQAVQTIAAQKPRAVIVRGDGDAFSAGGDLAMLERLGTMPQPQAERFMQSFYGRYLSLRTMPCPTIAAVHGAAVGAGLCVALSCDLMVVEDDAKLALNFTTIGIHPGMGGTYFLKARVGELRARELLLTGRFFSGRDAINWGMALPTSTTASDESTRLATHIAGQAPVSVRGVTAALRNDNVTLAAALASEAELQSKSYGTKDFMRGIAAIKTRSKPAFEGN